MSVGLQVSLPRLLPLTILTMGGSLLLHVVHLVGGWTGPMQGEVALMVPAARAEGVGKPPVASPAAPRSATAPAVPATNDATSQPPPAAPPMPIAVAASRAPPVSESERALLQDLRARRGELEQKATGLSEREALLAAAEKRLGARLTELGALQQRLEQMDAARKSREEADWQGMVKVYETMKPHDAATIFNDLDMPVLLQVLDRMKASKAAVVLGAMQPERARQVTAQLADLRNKREKVPGGQGISGG